MTRHKGDKGWYTEERYQEILKSYDEFRAKEGERAPYMAKGFFYEKVAEKHQLSPQTAGIIIRRMLKMKTGERV